MLALLVLFVDINLKLGVAGGVPYISAVLVALRSPWPHHAAITAGICSVLVWVGYYLSPPGGEFWVVITNRFLALLAIWTTAAGITLQKATESRLNREQAAYRAYEEKVEREFEQQKALAAIGTMAAVIAHEIRNPLTGIGGALQVLSLKFQPRSREAEVIDSIQKRIKGLDDSLSDMLEFARPREPVFRPLPLLDLLRDTAEIVAGDPISDDISMKVTGEDLLVYGDKELVRGAFTNLLLNAAQAIKGVEGHEGGVIEVKLSGEEDSCVVTITDNGPGIPQTAMERIYEPFYTTRTRGTGLGLFVVRRTVVGHGGDIEINCPGGGGTVVSIRLARFEGDEE